MSTALAAALVISLAGAPDWEPPDWPSPGLGVSAAAPAPPPRSGLMEAAYRLYRQRSAENGGGCPYYPTCSGYGILAWRSWGLPVGVWLTADRLMREYPGMQKVDHYPIVTPHGIPRLDDPVPARRGPGRRDP